MPKYFFVNRSCKTEILNDENSDRIRLQIEYQDKTRLFLDHILRVKARYASIKVVAKIQTDSENFLKFKVGDIVRCDNYIRSDFRGLCLTIIGETKCMFILADTVVKQGDDRVTYCDRYLPKTYRPYQVTDQVDMNNNPRRIYKHVVGECFTKVEANGTWEVVIEDLRYCN